MEKWYTKWSGLQFMKHSKINNNKNFKPRILYQELSKNPSF